MHMSNMTDPQRLALLKEIGGTGVYEERRKESLKVMADTESRRTQIEETVSEWSTHDSTDDGIKRRRRSLIPYNCQAPVELCPLADDGSHLL